MNVLQEQAVVTNSREASEPSATPANQNVHVAPPVSINPAALTVEQVSQLLIAAGSKHANVETIRRHIESGAPVSSEGKINLLHYTAWLVREVSHAEDC
jgi:hypothetical protein